MSSPVKFYQQERLETLRHAEHERDYGSIEWFKSPNISDYSPCVYLELTCDPCRQMYRSTVKITPQSISCPRCKKLCKFAYLGRGVTACQMPFHAEVDSSSKFIPSNKKKGRIPWGTPKL